MNASDYRILLVDDEENICFTLGRLLKNEGYQVETASKYKAALDLIQSGVIDLAFIDIMLAGENGISLMREIRKLSPATHVVMFTGCPDVETASQALREGAIDYLAKPVRFETLMAVTRHSQNVKRMSDEQDRHRANLDAIFSSVTDSIIMLDREGHLIHYNSAAQAVCGYSDKSIGMAADGLGMGCRGACRNLALQVLQDGASRNVDRAECVKADGTVRLVSLTVTPVLGADKSINGAVAVIRDETRLVELESALQHRNRFYHIIGSSLVMRKLYTLTESLANVQTTVLINGESGTGKELFAAALHNAGSRRHAPLVKVNCAALSENLLESELFGHIRGAFTGAIADKVGRFEKAHGGTIFLDEIGDISPAMQMRLLRVLQEQEIERVGDSITRKVNVRVIAATNQNLSEKVRQGTFRQDLYYRINVVRLELPPLRERTDDIPPLVAHFLDIFNEKFGNSIRLVSDDVMTLFMRYPWPGNIRELEHVIEHACIICHGDVITVADLPREILAEQNSFPVESTPSSLSLPQKLTLEEALALSNGNKSRAARLLGISRRTVYRHLGE